MFSTLLKIIPKLDSSGLRQMEKQLQSRFVKVAKGFGKGLVNTIKGGGIAAIALTLIDKLLNPLKEIQEAIDKTLASADDISTNAKQFNTTSGKLFKVISLAKAAGLDQDNLFLLITKYQTAVAEAKANPQKPSAVSNFVDVKDTVEGFFEFIQSLQRKNTNDQVLIQKEVFGEKQILKMSDFLNSNFKKAFLDVGLNKVPNGKLTKNIDSLGAKNDLADTLSAKLGVKDIQDKARVITNGMIYSRAKADEIALMRENKKIKSYEDLASISNFVEKILSFVDDGYALLARVTKIQLDFYDKIWKWCEKLSKLPLLRGIFGKKDS